MSDRPAHILCCLLTATLATDVASQDLLDLSLEELMQVDVASRLRLSADRQPVSLSTVDAKTIRMSGARTLNELLMLTVPGYFLVEDQDDTVVGVRGLAPDNNSKVMLLLDGRNLNAEWFWGPPDALLNGIDLAFIERIEVVRGPGSVTQGQGALLGVVNIVTRREGSRVEATVGDAGRIGLATSWSGDLPLLGKVRSYLSQGAFDGRPYRNEGLGQQVEQGLSVYQRNHHLRRGDYRHAWLAADGERLGFRLFRFDGRRDLYNWRRDRDQLRQILTGAELTWRGHWLGADIELNAHAQQDDHALRTVAAARPGADRELLPGLVLGGHRERRAGLRAVLSTEDWLAGHRLVLGAEWNRYHYGLSNRSGDNFLLNDQRELLARGRAEANRVNRWVVPGRVRIASLFAEDLVSLTPKIDLVLGLRYDDHPDWGSELSPRLALLYQQSPNTSWRLSGQRGFRGAVGVSYGGGFEGDGLLREANFTRVTENPYFRANGNANLSPVRPETLTSLELSLQHRFASGPRLDAVLFRNTVRNVIGVGAYFLADPVDRAEAIATQTRIGDDRIGDWGGVFYFQNNAGALHQYGFELGLDWRFEKPDLELAISQSVVKVARADPGQFGPGNIYVAGTVSRPTSRSYPENVTRLMAHWRPAFASGRLALRLTGLYYPSWRPPVQIAGDGTEFTPRLPGATLLNLALAWTPTSFPDSEWVVEAKNLLDEKSLYPATSVAGEGEGNLGVPGIEEPSLVLTWRKNW